MHKSRQNRLHAAVGLGIKTSCYSTLASGRIAPESWLLANNVDAGKSGHAHVSPPKSFFPRGIRTPHSTHSSFGPLLSLHPKRYLHWFSGFIVVMTNMVADFFLPRTKDELPPFLPVTSYPALSSFLTDPANSTVDQLMQLRPKCLFDAQNRVLLTCNTRPPRLGFIYYHCDTGPILRNFSGCTISKVHVWCNALTLSKVTTS